MPAARPTQPAITNALGALMALGLTPGALVVNADGSFRVDILQVTDKNSKVGSRAKSGTAKASEEDEEPKRWGTK